MIEKVLIDDDRLTPTMKRIRSGRTQLFREPNIDNSFTNEENAAAVLVHPTDKAMYAELIDDEWYWVTGCAECKGETRDWMSYIECEKHDVCSCCSISREKASKTDHDAVWGGGIGWTCNNCQQAKFQSIRDAAFEKFNSEERDDWDFISRDEIICPHCGSELNKEGIHENEDTECGVCYGELHIEVEYSFHYTTSIKGERVTE